MPTPTNNKPVVAIVGRPNVGKSAIFNRLAGKRIAIVHDQPGVTRDRITAECAQTKTPFTMIDTGGICSNVDEGFSAQVETEADIAIASADLVRAACFPGPADMPRGQHATFADKLPK